MGLNRHQSRSSPRPAYAQGFGMRRWLSGMVAALVGMFILAAFMDVAE
jgi:hypothetical protein